MAHDEASSFARTAATPAHHDAGSDKVDTVSATLGSGHARDFMPHKKVLLRCSVILGTANVHGTK